MGRRHNRPKKRKGTPSNIALTNDYVQTSKLYENRQVVVVIVVVAEVGEEREVVETGEGRSYRRGEIGSCFHFESLEMTRISAPFSSFSLWLSARSWSTV